MEFIVRGSTLVNSGRCFTADIWVQDQIIHYIHEHIPPKPPIKEIDGSDCYMLPGLFRFGSSLGSGRTNAEGFKHIQEQWLREGYTAYVDDLTVNHGANWRTLLGYELAMHHNSWLEYKVRLRVPYRLVNESLIRAVLAHRIPMLEMILLPSDSLSASFWSLLLAGFSRYRLALKLSFVEECTLRERKHWLAEHLPLLVTMLEYRGISLILDEHPKIIKSISDRKGSYGAYVTWEMDKDSELAYDRKQFGMFSISSTRFGQLSMNERTLQRIVEIGSQQPARLFGSYPQKGALVAGSEADFFLLSKKNFKNPATFWSPSLVYTRGRRNKYLLFTEKDANRCNIAL
ncbi:hypothetical protein [Aneurinibacillus aneurinilyticus]|jgi:hypothetical protein|uniref:hypothetical protein n=1 Tax=Aneurinibacillus aneurinilyticus TaxID=1391 RepID=UPI0023F49AE9|nr:hypothetical protein [Aneurinibacillus aneurinilyticus]MCI1692954.1 hypothetical protein [Aneurinibacillus aneurinilyticus]